MNLKFIIVLFFSSMGLTINLQAQNNKQTEETKKTELQKKPEPLQTAFFEKRVKQAPGVNKPSQYKNKDQEILARLNTAAIPEDFPKYKAEYTEEKYNLLMDKWYNTHNDLLKKETNTNSQK